MLTEVQGVRLPLSGFVQICGSVLMFPIHKALKE